MNEKLSGYQEAALNAGWRIPFISYRQGKGPMTFGFETWSGYAGAVGAVVFCVGIGMVIYAKEHAESIAPGLIAAGCGWIAALSSVGLRMFLLKNTWLQKEGRVVDREVRHFPLRTSRCWDARLLCEYEANGTTIQCTPFLTYTGYGSSTAAWADISDRHEPDNSCRLLVNPKNPLHVLILKRRSA